jgi:hypothetical protein
VLNESKAELTFTTVVDMLLEISKGEYNMLDMNVASTCVRKNS